MKSLEAGKRKLEVGLEAKGRGEKRERGKEEMEEVGERVASPFLGGLQGWEGQLVFSPGSLSPASHNAPLLDMREDGDGNSLSLPQPSNPSPPVGLLATPLSQDSQRERTEGPFLWRLLLPNPLAPHHPAASISSSCFL